MSTKFISSLLVLLSVIFSGCNKAPQLEAQKAVENKPIIIKTDKDLAKSVHETIGGRKVKSYIQQLLSLCAKTRSIDLENTSIQITSKGLKTSEIQCLGSGLTVNGRIYVNLNTINIKTVIKLSSDSPLLKFALPDGKTALFLAEGYQLGKSKSVGKNQIGVTLVDTKK
jgi:spore coat polysaccharide biosynthesis protein SpsF (cytidylyltransferase family)